MLQNILFLLWLFRLDVFVQTVTGFYFIEERNKLMYNLLYYMKFVCLFLKKVFLPVTAFILNAVPGCFGSFTAESSVDMFDVRGDKDNVREELFYTDYVCSDAVIASAAVAETSEEDYAVIDDYYDSYEEFASESEDCEIIEEEAPVLFDIGATQDVSGYMPEHVLIRTMTQSYCKYYEFIIDNGLVYAKKAGDKNWKLFLDTGLPFFNSSNPDDYFKMPKAVRELCCDADSLYVFDDQGIMYSIFIAKGAPEKILKWRRLSGFPKKNYVIQDDLVLGKRGWSMGTRRGDILWYEDRYGNQHHWGTMGLETIYFLTEDGQHIRFTDSGVPADFSHSIECPEHGAFISRNISVSGDTVFLIGDRGTMYTRLIDFDTMGCDPMFFQYTYDKLEQKSRGSDYISNYTPWALPNEDWTKQPPIPLEEGARLTKMISIAQTGLGNYARELRVAGTDKDGQTGYYHKMLGQRRWNFTQAELVLDESVFLDSSKPEMGESTTYSYTGYIAKNDAWLEGFTCSISGVSLSSEDRAEFVIQRGNEKFKCRLYPVEKWTFVKRYAPGFDGTPKYYFITAEFNNYNFSGYSKEFAEILNDIFKDRSHELFAYASLATTEYYEIDADGQSGNLFSGGRMSNKYRIFMTADGTNTRYPKLLKGNVAMGLAASVSENPLDESLILDTHVLYHPEDCSLIVNKIEENKKMRTRVRKYMEDNYNSHGTAQKSRWGYNLVDIVTRLTFLNRINFPKIKQVTSFGGDLMDANASLYRDMLSYSDWTYPGMLELADLRIKYYQVLLDQLRNGKDEASLREDFFNSFSEYYRYVGVPEHLEGNGDRLDEISMGGVFPWFMLQKSDGTTAIVRLKNSARTILDSKDKYTIEANFTLISVPGTESAAFPDRDTVMADWDNFNGEFVWNGKTVKIYIKNALFTKKCIFEGSESASDDSVFDPFEM